MDAWRRHLLHLSPAGRGRRASAPGEGAPIDRESFAQPGSSLTVWTGNMPDTSCLRFLRFAEPRTRRSEPEETQIAIDDAQLAVTEPHDVASILEFGEADKFPSERLANEHLLSSPLDRAQRAHAPDLVIGIVPGVLQPPRQLPRGRAPMLGRRHLAQCLVRA